MPTKFFTRENAGEMARRSTASRMARLRIARLNAQASPSTPLSERLTLIDEQITRTRLLLNEDKMEPHHRAQLLRALDGLIERERVLRQGHPGLPRGNGTMKNANVSPAPMLENIPTPLSGSAVPAPAPAPSPPAAAKPSSLEDPEPLEQSPID